jgi:hypothetical protein
MKTYAQMIEFIVYAPYDRFRYNEWPAVLAIAEAYGIPQETVFADVKAVKEIREKAKKAAQKEARRIEHEERRRGKFNKENSRSNNMKQLYAIIESGGSYDDSWESVRFVTDDLAKAESYVDKMSIMIDSLDEARESLDAWTLAWHKSNPQPNYSKRLKNPVPKWSSTVMVTEEMRQERRLIEAENNKIRQQFQQEHMDWMKRRADESDKWLIENYSEEIRQGLKEELDNTHWTWELVEWLE